jgi:hypothetical protein
MDIDEIIVELGTAGRRDRDGPLCRNALALPL